RRIVGTVKPREQARQIYEKAKAAGHVAGLLDQERPNIFTQSVANIDPGAEVVIEIGYVETLKQEDGVFEWVFPMVVGPRYIPAPGVRRSAFGVGSDDEGRTTKDEGRIPNTERPTPSTQYPTRNAELGYPRQRVTRNPSARVPDADRI